MLACADHSKSEDCSVADWPARVLKPLDQRAYRFLGFDLKVTDTARCLFPAAGV
jgi:hypothetical protein